MAKALAIMAEKQNQAQRKVCWEVVSFVYLISFIFILEERQGPNSICKSFISLIIVLVSHILNITEFPALYFHETRDIIPSATEQQN